MHKKLFETAFIGPCPKEGEEAAREALMCKGPLTTSM